MVVYYLVDKYNTAGGLKQISVLDAIKLGYYMPYSDRQIKTRKIGDNGTMEDFKRFARANHCKILTDAEFEAYLVRLPMEEQDKHRDFIKEMLQR